MLHCGRHFQRYVVDMCVTLKKETQRLFWIRKNQTIIRSALYQGLNDHMLQGDKDTPVGRRIVLPCSVTCNPRYMLQKYQDAVAIVRKFGKTDFWQSSRAIPVERDSRESSSRKDALDRPDLVYRGFNQTLKTLRNKIMNRQSSSDD